MSSTPLLLARGALLAALACAAPVAAVHAQSAPPPDAAQATPEPPRRNQKIEHIRVEDAGARVDEVRYGGQTQSITVQPKGNVPSYEVRPNNTGRDRQGQSDTSGGNGNGARVWDVLKF